MKANICKETVFFSPPKLWWQSTRKHGVKYQTVTVLYRSKKSKLVRLGMTTLTIFGSHTLGGKSGKSHVLIHQVTCTVATLSTAWESAASAGY